MGSRIFTYFVRRASELSVISQKRFRTKWISRHPVKVYPANASDGEHGIEEKLNIERKILKGANQAHAHEEPLTDRKETDMRRSKLSAVAAGRSHKSEVDENGFMDKGELKESVMKAHKLRRADPFGLSSLLPEENDSNEIPDTGLPPLPDLRLDGNSIGSDSSNVTFAKEPSRDGVQASDANKKSTKNKTKHDTLDTSKPQVIKPKGDEQLRKLMLLTKSKKMREKHNLVAAEGKRLIKDFIDAGATPKIVFFSRQQEVDDIRTTQNHTEFYWVPYKQLSLWTDVETSQGVIGLFEISEILKQTPAESSLPITVICDNVRDPGNMGSMLRIAAGAGCEKVILTKGCVDSWDSKVLRSAAGAHGRIPLIKDISWEVVPEHVPDGSVIFAAESSAVQNHVTPLLRYDTADFSLASHIVLIVGGETHGLSSSAMKMASACLHVPLSLGVESLNTAVAFAIIVFEAKRHLTAGI